MDGGIVNNAPIAHAVELGADRVFVLSAMGPSQLEEAPRGAMAAGITGITRAITRRLEEDIGRYGDVVDLIVLPAPTLPGLLPTDFGHADELIEQGLHRARTSCGATTRQPGSRAAPRETPRLWRRRTRRLAARE